jgi:predicted dithiol-disulfide oxidoreductase (DUF899 family)
MGIGRLPNEAPEYAKLRDELLEAEIALRDQVERVALLRRSLPSETEVADASFEEIRYGVRVPVRLSELFEDPQKTLVLVHFMFGAKQGRPCPMCTLWADGYDGIVPHLRQRVNFAVLVAGDVGAFGEYARRRGWRNLRLVSAAGSDLKRSLGFEAADGSQHPGVSVFRRQADGRLVHFVSTCAMLADGQFRGMDLLSPLWNFLDLTPEGRGDWMPRVEYG